MRATRVPCPVCGDPAGIEVWYVSDAERVEVIEEVNSVCGCPVPEPLDLSEEHEELAALWRTCAALEARVASLEIRGLALERRVEALEHNPPKAGQCPIE